MLTIKCDKCGATQANTLSGYQYLWIMNGRDEVVELHICPTCNSELDAAIVGAVGAWAGAKDVIAWGRQDLWRS